MVGSTTVSIIGMTGRNTLKSALETLSSHLDWGVQRGGPNRRMKGMASGYRVKTYLQIRPCVKMLLLIMNPHARLKKL